MNVRKLSVDNSFQVERLITCISMISGKWKVFFFFKFHSSKLKSVLGCFNTYIRLILLHQFKNFQRQEKMSRVMRKSAFCICENKDADQLRGNREADQHLCFRYIACTIPLLP